MSSLMTTARGEDDSVNNNACTMMSSTQTERSYLQRQRAHHAVVMNRAAMMGATASPQSLNREFSSELNAIVQQLAQGTPYFGFMESDVEGYEVGPHLYQNTGGATVTTSQPDLLPHSGRVPANGKSTSHSEESLARYRPVPEPNSPLWKLRTEEDDLYAVCSNRSSNYNANVLPVVSEMSASASSPAIMRKEDEKELRRSHKKSKEKSEKDTKPDKPAKPLKSSKLKKVVARSASHSPKRQQLSMFDDCQTLLRHPKRQSTLPQSWTHPPSASELVLPSSEDQRRHVVLHQHSASYSGSLSTEARTPPPPPPPVPRGSPDVEGHRRSRLSQSCETLALSKRTRRRCPTPPRVLSPSLDDIKCEVIADI